jgi:hypothetical protein
MKIRTTMKLSENTLNILKNFSSINHSILIKKGSTLRTISVMKNIFAEATIEETFIKDFAIYDLNEFLSGLSLHKDPDIDFEHDSYLVIREGKRRVKYFYADPEIIVCPPEKEIILPSKDVCFELDHSQLNQLIKAASVYKLPDLAAVGDHGVISLVVTDKNNESSNEYSIIVGETDNKFKFNFKVENIKIIPASYEVIISSKGFSYFHSKKYNLNYFIALEPDSIFE